MKIMESQENVPSFEQILRQQQKRLGTLETATKLIQDKKINQLELLEAYNEVCLVSKDINNLKEDVNIMKVELQRCKELSSILKSLDRQILRMEQNIPRTIKEYIESSVPQVEVITDSTTCTDINLNNRSIINECTKENDDITDLKKCKKILFNEPEIPKILSISQQEFKQIPKYIIGRNNLESLNSFIASINQIITTIYTVLAMDKNTARKKGELDAYLHYKKEQMNFDEKEKNTYAFTAADYEKFIKRKLDKTKLNLIVALRHCKRIREIRTAKTVYYALILSEQ